MATLSVADLFAGAGGMSLGFCEAGFAHALGVDRDEDAVATYRENIGDAMRADVFDRQARRQIADELRGRVDVLIGGPPCQPFSQAGKQRGEADARDGWPAFLRMMALNAAGRLHAHETQRVNAIACDARHDEGAGG